MLRLDFNLVFTVLNILIWYVLIRKFLFKPINDIISKREDAINSRYEEAKKLQEEAQAEKEKSVQYQNQIESEKARRSLMHVKNLIRSLKMLTRKQVRSLTILRKRLLFRKKK
mgnify:CR=1 FL=1